MITLSNGCSFEYMAASGALADGWGWFWDHPFQWFGSLDLRDFLIVAKTVTRWPRDGNFRWYWPWGSVRPLRGGMLNSFGLRNGGIDQWCWEVGPRVRRGDIRLVASIHGSTTELVKMIQLLNTFDLVGVEVNASCPNVGHIQSTHEAVEACLEVKAHSRHPVGLKLSVVHDVEAIIPKIEDCVEWISINSVPWRIAFPDKVSPLEHLGGGGVSGKPAQTHNWRLVERLVRAGNVSVVGPSVWSFDDIAELRKLGARAIGFGAIFRYPWKPNAYIRRDRR